MPSRARALVRPSSTLISGTRIARPAFLPFQLPRIVLAGCVLCAGQGRRRLDLQASAELLVPYCEAVAEAAARRGMEGGRFVACGRGRFDVPGSPRGGKVPVMFLDDQHLRLLHVTVMQEGLDDLEQVLSEHSVEAYIRHPKSEGDAGQRGRSKAVVQALVYWAQVEPLLAALRKLRTQQKSLRAALLPVEATV